MINESVVLIVDDEPRTVKGICNILKKNKGDELEIFTSNNGLEAIDLLKTIKIDLLLLDIKMPEMDGISVLEVIDKEEDIKVSTILLTGYAEFEYARSAIRFNVLNYLLKPVGKDILIDEVEKGIKHSVERRKLEKRAKILKKCPQLFEENMISCRNPYINEAIKYINNNFSKDITLKMIANYVHISESYFSVLFKEEIGMTFTDYLTKLRIKKAKQFLIEYELKIYEIADKVGYHSAKYFIKVFRKNEGSTPNQFRKNLNNNISIYSK